MQQFVIPQFIDVEDKIIGPITVRQFIIMLAGGGLVFISYKLSDFTLFLFFFIVISSITFSFAFIKINGRPLHYLVLNFFQTFRRPKIKVWQKKLSDSELKVFSQTKKVVLPVQVKGKNRVRASRLAELSLIVDTGGVYQGENYLIEDNLT